MNGKRSALLQLYKFIDLSLLVCAFAVCSIFFSYQSQTLSFSQLLSIRISLGNLIFFASLMYVSHIIFSRIGSYHSKRFVRFKTETTDTVTATTIISLLIFAISIIFKIGIINYEFIILFWILSSLLAVSFRATLKFCLRWMRLRGRNLRHMLIIGTNSRAIQFAKEIEESPELGYRIAGFADDQWYSSEKFKNSNDLVTDFHGLPEYLRTHVVDEVVISLPLNSLYTKAADVASLSRDHGIIIRHLSNIFNLKSASAFSDELGKEAVIGHYIGRMNGWQLPIKGVIDFCGSFLLLLLLFPLFLVVGLLIKLTSPGPIFFIQERVGLNKRIFKMYKFRTMSIDAEKKQAELEKMNEVKGPVFKIKNDPRITAVGRFLRKTSIDELPQLMNVLRGEMSLVGPRPLPIRDYEGFNEDWHRRRFSVRPGITCLWQINGRTTLNFEQWMHLDIQYIDQWSLWLDLKILLSTIPAVIKCLGAS